MSGKTAYTRGCPNLRRYYSNFLRSLQKSRLSEAFLPRPFVALCAHRDIRHEAGLQLLGAGGREVSVIARSCEAKELFLPCQPFATMHVKREPE